MKLTLHIETADDIRQAHALLSSLLAGTAASAVDPEADDTTESAAEIGMAIATYRNTRGWSQGELAQRCGVSQTAVSQWEGGLISLKGARRARARVLRAVAQLS